MKKTLLFVIAIMIISISAFAQEAKKKNTSGKKKSKRAPAGYMGLWDMNASAGYLHPTEHHTYTATDFEDKKANGAMVMIHIQESVLSNYIWATESDKKIKFGITETLDLGCSYLFNKKTNTSTNGYGTGTVETKSTNFGFLFAYEAGGGVVYKINNDMDAGFTFYALALSTFTNNTRYAKFRFRYTNFMAELSTFGKTGVDLKYMTGAQFKNKKERDRESSHYFGISIFGNHESSHNWSRGTTYVYFNYGFLF